MILILFKTNGDDKPSGSYTELNLDSILLFVAGLSFDDILNPNGSVLMFHTNPNALSFCTSPLSSSLMLMFFCNPLPELISSRQSCCLQSFCLQKMNPPALQIFLIVWIRSTASSIPLKDFSISST